MDKDLKSINEKLDKLISYFNDEPTHPGVFSRIRKNEDHRKLATKINWMLVTAMFGLLVKSFS